MSSKHYSLDAIHYQVRFGKKGANLRVDRGTVEIVDRDGFLMPHTVAPATIASHKVALAQLEESLRLKQDKISIHPDSATQLEIDSSDRLRMRQLGIINVFSASEVSLTEWTSSNYTGTELQEGDVLYLQGSQTAYIHNGGNFGGEADFSEVFTLSITLSDVLAAIDSAEGVSVDLNGVISLEVDLQTLELNSNSGKLQVPPASLGYEKLAELTRSRIEGKASSETLSTTLDRVTANTSAIRVKSFRLWLEIDNPASRNASEPLSLTFNSLDLPASALLYKIHVRVTEGFVKASSMPLRTSIGTPESPALLLNQSSDDLKSIDWETPGDYVVDIVERLSNSTEVNFLGTNFEPGVGRAEILILGTPHEIGPIETPSVWACSDSNLHQALRDRGIETVEDLETQTFLDLNKESISSIDCLAPAVNLVELRLNNNAISDLTPLSGMSELKTLKLWVNQVWDLSPIAALPQIETLILEDNQISDLSPLANLTTLKRLDLQDNPIENDQLIHLTGLSNLSRLFLEEAYISDITPLASLPRLNHLDIRQTQVTDLSPLSGITRSATLIFRKIHDLTDISPLTGVPVYKIDLSYTSVTDLTPLLGSASSLHFIDLRNNNIADISDLLACDNLGEVQLSANTNVPASQIADLEAQGVIVEVS